MPTRTLRLPALPPSPVVLLLIDFVNPLRFDGAQRLRSAAVEAALATAQLRRQARSAQAQTIYANDNYGVWRSDFKDLWARCRASSGAPGAIARALRPHGDDFAILKPRHSAFYSTPLELLLQQLKCKRLILTGIAADNCVLFTAMDAYLRGYELWIPEDCIAAESAQAKQQAIEQMRRVLKAHTQAACLPR